MAQKTPVYTTDQLEMWLVNRLGYTSRALYRAAKITWIQGETVLRRRALGKGLWLG